MTPSSEDGYTKHDFERFTRFFMVDQMKLDQSDSFDIIQSLEEQNIQRNTFRRLVRGVTQRHVILKDQDKLKAEKDWEEITHR